MSEVISKKSREKTPSSALERFFAFCRKIWQSIKKFTRVAGIYLQKIGSCLAAIGSAILKIWHYIWDDEDAPDSQNSARNSSRFAKKPQKSPGPASENRQNADISPSFAAEPAKKAPAAESAREETPAKAPAAGVTAAKIALPVSEIDIDNIMLPADELTFIEPQEVLGPLKLNQLYLSGQRHFPVRNSENEIIGIVHTARLNSLMEKKSPTACDVMDPSLIFLRDDYSTAQAMAAFLRSSAYAAIVVDKFAKTVGMVSLETILEHITDNKSKDSDGFIFDTDRMAVATRKLPKEGS